jgi:Protein of unknown function (DUF3237)
LWRLRQSHKRSARRVAGVFQRLRNDRFPKAPNKKGPRAASSVDACDAARSGRLAAAVGRGGYAGAAGEARWDWDTKFLWTCTVAIRKQVIGELPDGLRINFEVTDGRFVGPRFEGIVLPGGVNWMRIREDGVAIVNVTECLQTRTGARIDSLYGGIFDLGATGYARAMRGEFDPLPPFIVAPTYVTADKELAWLNRIQCIGVGRVDMKALRADYDVYAVTVGTAKRGGHWSRKCGGAQMTLRLEAFAYLEARSVCKTSPSRARLDQKHRIPAVALL